MRSVVVSRMTMRARILRNNAGEDAYGHRKNPDPDELENVSDAESCFVWVKNRTEVVDGKSVVVEEIHGYFRPNADIQRDDIIESVVDRRGETLFEGKMAVDSIIPVKQFARPAFLDVLLRRANG